MRPSRAWQGWVDRTRSGEAPQTNPVLLIYTPAASPGSTTDAVEKPTMGDDAEPEIDFSMKKKKARRACRAHCTAQAQLYVHQAVSSLGGATPRVACSSPLASRPALS